MLRKILIAASAALVLGDVASAQTGGVDVQTEAGAYFANAGEKGAAINTSAMILVQVNAQGSGAPVANLGASAGNGTAGIALPSTLQLFSNGPVPAGGCLMSPTQFTNWGNGTYNIRVVPFLTNPNCAWLSGMYTFVVHVKSGGTIIGSGTGSFVVP